MRDSRWLTALGLAAGLAVAGCGGSQPRNQAPSAAATRAAFRGSPPVLSALHAQANRLLGGGPKAFRARLRGFRGRPVVVNLWASWCEPCQSEFPSFQKASVRFGRQVAFLGVDSRDTGSSAAAFLRRFPVTYPSYADPRQSIGGTLQAVGAIPQTVYISPAGRQVYTHAGPYLSATALEQDIRSWVLK